MHSHDAAGHKISVSGGSNGRSSQQQQLLLLHEEGRQHQRHHLSPSAAAGHGLGSRSVGPDSDMLMPAEEVAEVIASCFDCRIPPKNIFKLAGAGGALPHERCLFPEELGEAEDGEASDLVAAATASSSSHFSEDRNGGGGGGGSRSRSRSRSGGVMDAASQCWVSTGLAPQFICVSFFEKWIVKKVRYMRCR